MTALTTINTAAATIAQGQTAWKQIKATAAEQRTLWRAVGEALLAGKDKANRQPGQKFSDWATDLFPGLDTKNDVPAAIWFASAFPQGEEKDIPAAMTSPRLIREWANGRALTHGLPEDLGAVEAKSSLVLDPSDAKRVVKVALRAASGDEGADIAQRHLDAMARKNGTTAEALVEAAKVGDPDGYFRFPPTQLASLNDFRSGLKESAAEMEADGISREAICAIFLAMVNDIRAGR